MKGLKKRNISCDGSKFTFSTKYKKVLANIAGSIVIFPPFILLYLVEILKTLIEV